MPAPVSAEALLERFRAALRCALVRGLGSPISPDMADEDLLTLAIGYLELGAARAVRDGWQV